MSRVDNVVFINNSWKRGVSDIEEAFNIRDTVYINAQGDAIEIAVSLAEHFVKKLSIIFMTLRNSIL